MPPSSRCASGNAASEGHVFPRESRSPLRSWLLERAHLATRRFPRLPPPSASDNESAALLESIVEGEYETPPGLLCVYASVARSSFVCHEALQRGFEAFQLSPGTFACLTTLIQDAICACDTVRPVRLTERASQLIITQCAVHVLSTSAARAASPARHDAALNSIHFLGQPQLYGIRSLIDRTVLCRGNYSLDTVGTHTLNVRTQVLSSSLDALESYEPQIIRAIPAHIISQHCPAKRILTRSVLQVSPPSFLTHALLTCSGFRRHPRAGETHRQRRRRSSRPHHACREAATGLAAAASRWRGRQHCVLAVSVWNILSLLSLRFVGSLLGVSALSFFIRQR